MNLYPIFWGHLHQILKRFIRLPKRLRSTVPFEVQGINKYTYYQGLLYRASFKEVFLPCEKSEQKSGDEDDGVCKIE